MNPVYILGAGAICPQEVSPDTGMLLSDPNDYAGENLYSIEPDYAQYLDTKSLRRMSRILKMGTAASAMALREAGVAVPDAIITGTGYGCLEDTGSFMQKMVLQNELTLSPTPFIQSTHNTIGSQIALLLQCQGYNQTYAQESISFESGLIDAQLSLTENPNQIILTGGADEITELSHAIQKRFGVFKSDSTHSLNLFESSSEGILHGEGAFYFVLSGKQSTTSFARIDSVATFVSPSGEALKNGIRNFMERAAIRPDDIDLFLVGKSGDVQKDKETDELVKDSFGSKRIGLFKHLCGEFPTAAAFAVWLAARIIQTQHVPDTVMKNNTRVPKTILIYNPSLGYSHSLILLRAC